MAIDRRTAEIDLRDKLRFEANLRRQLRSLFATQLRIFARQVADTGAVNVVPTMVPPLESVLRRHHRRVAASFSQRLDRLLPSALRLREAERTLLAEFLARALADRAGTQALIISETTQREGLRALAFAQSVQQEAALKGEFQTTRDLALNAAAILRRMFEARLVLIVCTETQIPAELAKQAELQVMLGQDPLSHLELRAVAGTPRIKEWVSQGDSAVRPAHRIADGEQVPVDQPFEVGGELLMYPGDTSLGASAANVVNCRCAAVTDVESVASARQDIVGPGSIPPALILPAVTEAIEDLLG